MAIRLLPQYRGVRVRPYMRYMNYIIFGFLLLPFLSGLVFYVYLHIEDYQALDWSQIGLTLFLIALSLLLSVYLTWFLQETTPFFKKLERLGKLSFFLFENKYVYEKKKSNNQGHAIKFPKIYLQQGKYDLSVHFKMAGNKFQDKFKKIGGALEDTFFMDFMETLDEPKYKVYRLAYSAYLNRITIPDVHWDKDKGVELMKGFYWDFISDPHLLVAGGTGGGKTVLLRSLIRALSKVGVVDICDPKRADFATTNDIEAFKGRVVFEIPDIVSHFEKAVVIMMARYDFMRSEMKRHGHKDMKKFHEYGLEPYFFVCDEYNALMAMLSYKDRERVDNAIGQFLLLGRQAGCFGILAMQKPSREDLGSKLQSNINFRISVGRLDEMGYDILFGSENRNKEFKYLKYLGGRRIYGRGYAAVFGEVAREFYSPLLPKRFSFHDEFSRISRHENQFDPTENNQVSTDIIHDEDLLQFAESVSVDLPEVELPEIVRDSEFEEMEEMLMEEDKIGAKQLSKDLGKSLSQVVKLVALLEDGKYSSFSREDGEILFSQDQVQLMERLFEKKESGTETWKELLANYFG